LNLIDPASFASADLQDEHVDTAILFPPMLISLAGLFKAYGAFRQ
jgi:hypothetical protein